MVLIKHINFCLIFINFITLLLSITSDYLTHRENGDDYPDNCINIINYIRLSTINSGFILISLYSYFQIGILSFICNIFILIAECFIYFKLGNNCIDSYYNDYLLLWISYNYNILSHFLTLIFELIKVKIFVKIKIEENDKEDQELLRIFIED